ncbi:S1C family serine protease [Psychrobacillus sp. FSL W7-1457]|uniref:S1C family serine protease n=1 Tax=Psychrobacillus sp. FSL W7-1457 TaxID=2954547 RepID=UPI00315AE5E0
MIKGIMRLLIVAILLISVFTFHDQTANAQSNKVMWGKTELKVGQLGKVTVLSNTPLVKLESDGSLTTVRNLNKGEEFRVYSYKSNHGGLYGVGGGSFISKSPVVKYETPSKSKLALLSQNPANEKKVYSTKEIVEKNDDKVVLIETENSLGSGIVVGNGLILTNYHVIEGASKATITFNNGQQFEVEGIVEMDANKDIALLKTSKEFNISGVTIRSTNKGLSKGEKVVAIGSPVGLQNTVSEGIISSFRTSAGISLIQTTADIDNGSSGGALFNTNGQLIGMTTSGIDSLSANLNFAIATEVFVPLVNKYIGKNHRNINASFPIISTPLPVTNTPVFGDIAMGMTKQQVNNLSGGSLKNETQDLLFYSDVSVLGLLGDVNYEFKNNRLVAINIFHYAVDNQDIDTLEAYFVLMHDVLSESYGLAKVLDTNWFDDKDVYRLAAYWVLADHNTLLNVTITSDYIQTYGGLRISISE